MYLISSLSKRFSTLVFPSDKAARRRQRFDNDLDPGSVTVPSMDLMGDKVKVSRAVSADIWSLVEEYLFMGGTTKAKEDTLAAIKSAATACERALISI